MLDKSINWNAVMEKQHKELTEYSRFHDSIREIDYRAATNDIKLHFSTPLWQESEYMLWMTKIQIDRTVLEDTECIERQLAFQLSKFKGC